MNYNQGALTIRKSN